MKTQSPPTYKLRSELDYLEDAVSRFATRDGRLIRFYDAETGAPVDQSPIFEDFGDVAPFLYVIGGRDLAHSEFDALQRALKTDPAYVNVSKGRQWLVNTYDWTDMLLGLMEYYRLSQRIEALELADDILGMWVGRFCRHNVAYGRGVKLGGHVFALPLSTLIDVGMLPELLVTRAAIEPPRSGSDPIVIALGIVRGWISDPFFERNGLFPNVFVEGPRSNGLLPWIFNTVAEKARPAKGRTATLFKHNTNALASILSVWKVTKEKTLVGAIEKWTASCRDILRADNGMIAMQWMEGAGITIGPTDHNFQVVDLMCDIAHETRDQSYLDMAVSVATPWLESRGRTGLIPHHREGKYSRRAMSDSQTDFAVALLKLESLTGSSTYGQAAEDIMEAVKRHMYKQCGMANWVDIETGAPVDTTCKTKFFVLSVKAWLALENREKIYSDERFTELLNDR